MFSRATGLVRAGVLFGLWLLLVDNVQTPELVAGAVVAVLGAVAAGQVDRVRAVHPHLRVWMLRRIHRPLVLLITDSARVTWALARMLAAGERAELGRWRAVRYAAAGESPEDHACRTLTEWGASLGANRYAIGCDGEAGILLVHELVPSRGPLDPLEVG